MKRELTLLACLVFLGGCFTHVEGHCASCAIVDYEQPRPPAFADGKTAVVVLLHGAFGFGTEWDPILSALRERPELGFYAFAWPGPFGGKPPSRAEAFRVALQATIDGLPPSAHEVLVLSHSAGGPLAEYAARRLRVPEGAHVRIALLDAVRVSMAPEVRSERIDTPLGTAIGSTPAPEPPIPTGVVVDAYRASNPPRVREQEENGASVTYLGRKVTHGGAVGLAGLPLIAALPRR